MGAGVSVKLRAWVSCGLTSIGLSILGTLGRAEYIKAVCFSDTTSSDTRLSNLIVRNK